jgi:hypothetical protein
LIPFILNITKDFDYLFFTSQCYLFKFTSLFPTFPRSDFMSVLHQMTYGNMALIFLSHFHGYKKMKYLQTIGVHRMFLNVTTFSVTNRSISS